MRRIILCLIFAALLVVPAAAQNRAPVPDIVRYADYAPESAVIYAAIRMDAGFRETTNALLRRIEPLVGDSEVEDFFEFFDDEDLLSFTGDALVLTVLEPSFQYDNLLGNDAAFTLAFGVKDFEAAKTFIEEDLEQVRQDRGSGWLVYQEDDLLRVLLRDDVMIISTSPAFTDQLISGDYGKLSTSARFQDTLARLPMTGYDFLIYAKAGEILAAKYGQYTTAQTDTAGRGTAEIAPDPMVTLLGALGDLAVGGVNVGGRDLVIDATMLYGDAALLQAAGFDPAALVAPAVDLSFATRVASDTQVYLQSTNAGGLMAQLFDGLNVVGGLMKNSASARYFGPEGYVNDKMGVTVKAALGFGLAALTGLNIDSDVIDVLKGDFALAASVHLDRSGAEVPALLLMMDESGQRDNYEQAVLRTLDRAGYPGRWVPLRDGYAIDLSAFSGPFMTSMMDYDSRVDVATDPRYAVWFGMGSDLIAFGTAPAVQFALEAPDGSLADSAAYQHAVEAVFLDGAQGIMFVNVPALDELATNSREHEIARLVESISASGRADAAGISGRFAISLK